MFDASLCVVTTKGNCWLVFSALPREMIQFDYYFSNGLKPPPKICWLLRDHVSLDTEMTT